MWTLNTSLAGARLKRGLWVLKGWPWPFAKLCCAGVSEAEKQGLVDEFREGQEIFDGMKKTAHKGRQLQL
eukprot:6716938-Prorocentrum_lima.AAC.1